MSQRAGGHLYVNTEHILLALLREGHGVACVVLTQLGADETRDPSTRSSCSPASSGCRTRVASPPPGIRDYDVRIAQARQDKDAAIDAGDHRRRGAPRAAARSSCWRRAGTG